MKRFDWISFAVIISLIVIGLMMIYAAGYQPDAAASFFSSQAGKQAIVAMIGVTILLGCQLIDWKFWSGFAYPFYAITTGLLVLVLILGSTIKGSTSWFNIGGMSFQPSELAKAGTIMALASFLSHSRTRLSDTRDLMVASAIILIPTLLVLLQGDAGSAIVFLSIFIVLFREGMVIWIPAVLLVLAVLFTLTLKFDVLTVLPILLLAGGGFLLLSLRRKPIHIRVIVATLLLTVGLVVLGMGRYVLIVSGVFMLYAVVESLMLRQLRQVILLTTAVALLFGFAYTSSYLFENVLEAHQQERIKVWLKPEDCDPRGSLYNILQSKIAIGSGGFTGKGFLKGSMTKLNYVPEQSTDFIYSIIGEEHGFIGSVAVILLFLILMMRMINIGERATIPFIRHYAFGVTGVLFTHFFINVGMTMGIMPVIGIPLPFVSSGGSSLLGFSLMLGILLSLDASWMRSRRVI